MHVVDGEEDKPTSPVEAESAGKGIAVAAATTTVEDSSTGTSDVVKSEGVRVLSISPKLNGICDSAGEPAHSNNKVPPTNDYKVEILSSSSSVVPTIKEEPDNGTVGSSEPQDLTVTCTSSLDPPSQIKPYPSAKYISISVEQCQTTPSSHQSQPQGHPVKQPKPISSSSRKRSTKSCDSDEALAAAASYKRMRNNMDDRDAMVNMFVEQASNGGLDEVQRQADGLQSEISNLNGLVKTKELEWNELIRMKKLKEEMFLRLIRRKQLMIMSMNNAACPSEDNSSWDFAMENRMADFITNDEVSLNRINPRIPSNLTITKSQSSASQQLQKFLMQPHRQQPDPHMGRHKTPRASRASLPFPILPKPLQGGPAAAAEPPAPIRQGPTVNVKAIIDTYRQSHPETIPRRGRRMKAVGENMVSSSRGILSMSSLALGSGSQVRTVGSTSGPEEVSRPSSADSSRSDAINLKDVYVQCTKMGNSSSSSAKAPPPYPEVTLHPVVQSATGGPSPPPTYSSLLHGILTKAGTVSAGPSAKATAFSPTLARLLTTPDRPSTTTTITTSVRGPSTSTSSSPGPVSISELLSTSKTRNELTITPVVSNAQPAKKNEDAVSGSNSQEEDCDENDRLVIDEGDDADRGEDAELDPSEAVPECQGCHQKPAQFVCAGCGNQWYCSRSCQVSAWDEHSDVCSG